MPQVRVVFGKPDPQPPEAKLLIEKIRAAGFQAQTRGAAAQVAAFKNCSAVVIDLSRVPSYGKAVAVWLRGTKSLRHIPIIFVDGDPAKVASIQSVLPDVVYSTSAGVGAEIKRAVSQAKTASVSPKVIPKQMMDGSGRTTAQKLGIRESSKVLLIDAPPDYTKVLGPLPKDVELLEDADLACAVTLWFVRDAVEFGYLLPANRALAARSKLWVVWRKRRTDGFLLSMNGSAVRAAAIAVGLVDYKICSLNEVWSGMALAVKKTT